MDLSGPKDMFKSSKIFDAFNKKMAKYDNSKLQAKTIRTKYVQHMVASKATEASLPRKRMRRSLSKGHMKRWTAPSQTSGKAGSQRGKEPW